VYGHAVHANVPFGHDRQSVALEAPSVAFISCVNVVFPASHCTQACDTEYVPPLQVLQMDAPLLELYLPASHAMHADALELDVKNPGLHRMHAVAPVDA